MSGRTLLPPPAPPRLARALTHRLAGAGLELVAAVGSAGLLLGWSATVTVDPLDRVGQVSALAAQQLHFAIAGAVLVVGLLSIARWCGQVGQELGLRVGCAAAAGLSSGLVAGGMAIALHGTPWPLWAGNGDYVPIIGWINDMRAGGSFPAHYPPLFAYLMDDWSAIRHTPVGYGLKDLQLATTALYGPVAYLFWRLNLRPLWALGIGVVAMLPFVEPVKPYEQICLIALLPLLIALLRRLRHSGALSTRRALELGVGYGVGAGVLFLLYSGWFVWYAPGFLLAAAILGPWRRAPGRAIPFAIAALSTFTAVSWVHLRGLFAGSGALSDSFFYFDTCADPTYVAMWGNDRPYLLGTVWPPLGELGGVGVFTLLLAAGALIAIALGWRRTPVVTVGLCVLGAWFVRMWLASEAYATSTVRLYPRTTMAILYGLLVLAGYGVRYLVLLAQARLATQPSLAGRRVAPVGLLLIPLLFLTASAGSATVDKYLPNPHRDSSGWFAWIAQTSRTLTGRCTTFAALHGCGTSTPPVGIPPSSATCHAPGVRPLSPATPTAPRGSPPPSPPGAPPPGRRIGT